METIMIYLYEFVTTIGNYQEKIISRFRFLVITQYPGVAPHKHLLLTLKSKILLLGGQKYLV